MSSRQRNVLIAVLLLVFAGVTAAAVLRGTMPPADYTFVNGSEAKSLDPHTVTGVPDHRIVMELFEGLVRWDPKTLEPRPGVAERWELSDDKQTYTFYLRKNARWSDDTPVTAHDFLWSFRRLLHPETAAQYAYELWYAENAERYTSMDVKVGDQVEVELLERPKGAYPYARGELVKGKLIEIRKNAVDSENDSTQKPPEPAPATKLEPTDKQDDKPPFDNKATYVVEVDGQQRQFRKGGAAKPGKGEEDFKWLLIDFDTIGIKALDDYTIEFKLNHPVPYFVTLTGFYPLYAINRKNVESYPWPEWIQPENLVTNGPFRLQSRRIRDRVRLVKSDTYWDRDKVKLNTVDALACESETTALNMYMTGQVDAVADTVPMSVIKDLLASGRSDFAPKPYLGTYMYRLNVTHKPLDDVRVRKALSMAIDRKAIVDHVLKAGQAPALSVVPPVVGDFVPYTPAYSAAENVREAQRLLAEAGYPGGEGFPKLGVLYNDVELHSAIAQVIQSQWKENLGIDVDMQKQEWGAYQSAQVRLDYDIARYGWIGDYPDPATFLKMWVTDGGNNNTGWSNPEYDRLIKEAQYEKDVQKRLEIYHQAERVVMDEMPIIPLYYYVTMGMTAPYVKGVYPNMQNLHSLKEVYIDQEEKKRFNPLAPVATAE